MLTEQHVVLRALEREDLKVLHKWQNDEETMRLARSSPDHTISKEALEAKYEKALKGEDFSNRMYTIEEKPTKKPIGWCSITFTSGTGQSLSGDIGLAIGEKNRWRKGYGTEVVRLLLKEVFEQLNLHRVGWWTFADNPGSLALARKMGFKEEARIRDSVFFDNRFHDSIELGLLKDEYESMRPKPRPTEQKTGR